MADTTLDPSSVAPMGQPAPKTDPYLSTATPPAAWPTGDPGLDHQYPQPPYGPPKSDPAAYQDGGHAPYPAQQPAWGPAAGGYPAPNTYTQSMNVNVNVNAMAPTLVMAPVEGPSLIVRALGFLGIGWWLSGIAITVAYLLVPTIVGIPLSFMLFNKLPQITTMKARTRNWAIEARNGVSVLTARHTEQLNWLVRGLYFVFVGFWLGAIWLTAAWAIGVFIITLPVTLWMYDRAPAVLTLHRH